MKRIFALAGLICLLLPCARADGPDDQYFNAYLMIQDADSLKNSGETSQALAKYLEAQTTLRDLQSGFPDWNNQLVNSRLEYTADKITGLSGKQPGGTNALAHSAIQTNAAPKAMSGPTQPDVLALQNQIKMLQEQLTLAQMNGATMEAKLKEALGAQPSSADPREFAKAQEQIRSLQKENELLKVNLNQTQTPAAPVEDSKVTQQLKNDLAEANRKLAEQTELAAKLAGDNAALQLRAKEADPTAMAALRNENELLKKQIAESRNTASQLNASNASDASDLKRQLTEAQTQIAGLRSQQESLALERTLLQDKIKQLSTNSPAASPSNPQVEDASGIKRLERERDDLRKNLDAAQRELASKKNKAGATIAFADDSDVLRTRIAVLEAQAVPYTSEELALLKTPQATIPSSPNAGKASVRALSPGAAQLVAEAQRDFAAKNYSGAEAKYLQVIKQDDKNVNTLANLATIQMEMGRLDEAEKHLRQALAVDPNDAYSLSVLGNLKFRQEKYDVALDALSRAVKLDPQNPEIQNYLGLTLSQKGMRAAAETALRKAILLDPNYASAHNNLAVIYITGKPPAVALARLHYQKALAAGMPRNPDLEKMLDESKATDSSK